MYCKVKFGVLTLVIDLADVTIADMQDLYDYAKSNDLEWEVISYESK